MEMTKRTSSKTQDPSAKHVDVQVIGGGHSRAVATLCDKGNDHSAPEYMPPENYFAMIRAATGMDYSVMRNSHA